MVTARIAEITLLASSRPDNDITHPIGQKQARVAWPGQGETWRIDTKCVGLVISLKALVTTNAYAAADDSYSHLQLQDPGREWTGQCSEAM